VESLFAKSALLDVVSTILVVRLHAISLDAAVFLFYSVGVIFFH
jgi:hypothetical protein